MRILHVISGLTTGGAEAVLYRLVTGSPGVQHEVICLEGPDWYSRKLEDHGIRVHHIDWNSIGSMRAVLRLHALIRSIDADVVQTWMYRPNLFAGISSRIAGKPVVWNIRCSTFDLYPPATRALAYAGGFLARWVPEFVINCSAASQRIHARIGYAAVEGAVISNGYDSAMFRPDEAARDATRISLKIDPDRFAIATIGRWHPQKGLTGLLAAMRILKDRGVPVELLMIGRGLDAENPELKKAIEKAGCGDIVELLGERTDIADVARAIDLHVLASVGGEGFPNAVAETMLSGTPNVVTNVGEGAMIVGDTGWVVSPGNSEQLAAAIEQAYEEWASSKQHWDERRAGARQRLADNFTLDKMIAAYRKVWTKVARALDISEDKEDSRLEPASK